ncbi:MAG: pyridoxal phosphate-dependent decarboxylase family protein, partial [Bacteroidales bacterium]
MHQIQNFYSANYFGKEGEKILEKLNNYFEEVIRGAPDIQVLPSNNPEKLYKKYNSLLKKKITGSDFIDILINDSNHLHHPGYIGHQCAAPNPVTALASLVGSLLNNGSAVYEMGPANVAMERTVAHFFAREYNFPEGAEGLFTSGGSLGNLTALLAARQNQTEYDIWEEGVRLDDQPAFMISEASHYCIPRAVKIMGLGEKGIINIPVDNENRIRTDLLEDIYQKSLDNGKRVIALTANACSTSAGSYDNLEKIAAFCQKFNIWFHIDGAHGGAAILSEKYRHFLKGSE